MAFQPTAAGIEQERVAIDWHRLLDRTASVMASRLRHMLSPCVYIVVVVKNLVTLLGHLRYLSQVTLQNLRIVHVSNLQFSTALSRIAMESSKGVCGI